MSVDAKEYALEDAARSATGMTICREDRDQAIRDARFHGATLREIASVAGMSAQGVAKILAKGT